MRQLTTTQAEQLSLTGGPHHFSQDPLMFRLDRIPDAFSKPLEASCETNLTELKGP